MRKEEKVLKAIGLLVVAAVLLAFPLQSGSYVVFVATTIAIYAIVGIGYNMLAGMTGLLSIGHQGFFAIGAYTAGILAVNFDLPFVLTIPAAAVLTGVTGLLLGFPSIRMSGFYLAISTLAFGAAIVRIIYLWKDLTGGTGGIYVPPAKLGGLVLSDDKSFYYLTLVVLGLAILVARNIVRSRTARAWLAIRENETAAACMGINVTNFKLLVFVVSATYTGVAGALYGYHVFSLTPQGFNVWMSILFIAMVVLGGTKAVVGGALLGAIFLVGLPEALSPLHDFQLLTFGALIILAMLFMPGGLAEALTRLGKWLGAMTFQKGASSAGKAAGKASSDLAVAKNRGSDH